MAWPAGFNASGRVLDGPIAGVKVCLDLNSNLICDGPTIEPEAVTDAEGNYRLEYSGVRDAEALHVIAEVPSDALDVETGEPFGKPFTLMAPTNYPEVISPLSTLVSSEQISAKDTGQNLTAVEAESRVRQSLGLPDSMKLISLDYVKTSQVDAHNVAKVLTQALKEVQSTLIDTSEFSSAHQSAGRSPRTEAIKAAAAESRTLLSDAILRDSSILSESPLQKTEIKSHAATAKTSFSGKIELAVARAKLPADSINETLVKLLTTGLHQIAFEYEFYLWCKDVPKESRWWTFSGCSGDVEVRVRNELGEEQKTVVASLVRASGEEKGVGSTAGRKLLMPDKWGVWEYPLETPCVSAHCRFQARSDQEYNLVLDMENDRGWIPEKVANEQAWEYPIEGNSLCRTITRSNKTERACAKLRDLSGFSIRDLGYCSAPGKRTYFPDCIDPNAVLPPKSVGVDVYIEQLSEDYEVFGVNRPMWPTAVFSSVRFAREENLIRLTIEEAEFGDWRGPYVSVFFEMHPQLNGRYLIERRSDDRKSAWIRAPGSETGGKATVLNGGWLSHLPDASQSIDGLLQYFSDNSPRGFFQFEESECRIVGRISQADGQWTVNWFQGNGLSGSLCDPDSSPAAKRYEQSFPIERRTVKGQDMLRMKASDIRKILESDVFDFHVFFAVVRNKAGSLGVYNGIAQPGGEGVVRIMQSGNREIWGSRELVDAVNKSWDAPVIPWEEIFESARKQ